ncbi:MAG: hypothetical protein Q8L74_09195 [Nitrospirota bacterium]|nr:hypothetical protein [Nitrospirota bacterium]MDP2384606.1 hypothetical protein [Nitrospirota bacterium]MDP3596155.1 hypothetical protein [Nitrospirota bacterium]
MTLEDLLNGIDGFPDWSHADKIRFFAWFIHSKEEKDRFSPTDIRACYDSLSLEQPSNVNSYIDKMFARRPREVLRDGQGYALEKRLRDELEKKYGSRPATTQVDRLLLDLPSKIPDLAERIFLEETILCFRCKAYRATIVMAWNLAFDHLCNHIFSEARRIDAFNLQLPKSFPKARIGAVAAKDDFGELKESEVLQVARSANLISSDLNVVLKEKLAKRNTAAHPSSIAIAPHTAEEYVIDLINNAVLKLT